MATKREHIEFPCGAIPDDPDAARLVGLYPQRQEGLWMQRVRVPGGRLEGRQWRALADIARRHTPDTPLHLTTRQDIELHDLTSGAVPQVQSALAEADLSCVGACGDTLRNITICPGSGLCAGSVDAEPIARAVHQALSELAGLFAMPRKFKISFSACGHSCGKPWINDLGFVAADGGLAAIGAGSLGARPGMGIRLFERIEVRHAAAAALAAVKLFIEHGDRKNRTRARLRHVRERVGDAEFLRMLTAAFERERDGRDWPEIDLAKADGNVEPLILTFVDGDVSAAAADALAEIQDRARMEVRIDISHRVIVFAAATEGAAAVAERPALAEAAAEGVTIVACPGTHCCSRGLADSRGLAGEIRARFGEKLSGKLVCISGCPNNCGHSAVADIGLTGRIATIDGERQQAFDLFTGGGRGESDQLARPAGTKLTPAAAVEAISAHLAAGAGGE